MLRVRVLSNFSYILGPHITFQFISISSERDPSLAAPIFSNLYHLVEPIRAN